MGAGPEGGARKTDEREGAGPQPVRRLDSSHSEVRPTPPRGPGDHEAARPAPSSAPADTSRPSAPPPWRTKPRPEDLSTQEIAIEAAPPHTAEGAPAFARFGRFDLLGRLAVGGMAEILLARDSIEGVGSRQLVIKAVRGEYAEDGEFAKMFIDEGRLAMRLAHPNICAVYECGRHDGRFFIAMEYVHGRTLRDVLVRAATLGRTMPIPLLLRIVALVAEALDFAHRAKDSQGRDLAIVHRDVSPHNIMIRYDGVVKLLDFGVAKAEHGQHSTESGALKGKFGYMSPEQALGDPLDARADVFALGVCLFEAVTGRRLYHRKAQYDTLKAILETDPPPLGAFRDDVPDALETIVRRALAKDPDERYQRAADLVLDLESLLAELRAVASTARIGALMGALFEDEARRGPDVEVDDDLRARYAGPRSTGVSAAVAERVTRPRRMVWIGAAAMLALAAGAGALAASSNEPERPSPPSRTAAPSSVTGPAASAPAAPAPSVVAAPPDGVPDAAPRAEPGRGPSATTPPTAAAVDDTMPAAEAASGDPNATAKEEDETFRPSLNRARRPRRDDRGRRRRRGTVIVTDPGF